MSLAADWIASDADPFERYLTLWVALALAAGISLGQLAPAVPQMLSRFEYAQVSSPVALLIWAMILPMMVRGSSCWCFSSH